MPLSFWMPELYNFDMKRKESVEKTGNKNLANQLKARLYDKGFSTSTQVSATAPFLP